MADLPLVIVIALGAAAVGGPEAVRLLLGVAGRNPAADIMIIVFLLCAMTAFVLGTMLQARYIRVAVANDAAAAPVPPATARFAMVTLALAFAVAIFVAACLIAIPSVPAGIAGAARSCSV